MEKYNYMQAVTDSVKDYIADNDITVTADNREDKKNSRHGDYKQTLGRARGRIVRPVVLNK